MSEDNIERLMLESASNVISKRAALLLTRMFATYKSLCWYIISDIPCAPVSPVSPFKPCAPVAPASPVSPSSLVHGSARLLYHLSNLVHR
jgi:hypothetical protein